MLQNLINSLLDLSSPAIFILIMVSLLGSGLGIPIPEDITLIIAGWLAFEEKIGLVPVIFWCFLGVMLGDSIIYWLGAKYGNRLTNKWIFKKLLNPKNLKDVSERLQTEGYKLMFIARFMPGLRAPIYFSAGTLHLPFRIFFLFDGLAALISVPTIIYTANYFGDEIEVVIKTVRKVENGILFLILSIVAILAVKWYLKKRNNKK